MSTTYTRQTVMFSYPIGYDPFPTILNDSGVQTYCSYDIYSSAVASTSKYISFPAGVQTQKDVRLLSFVVSAANAANIVADLNGLRTRMGAAFPGLVIDTWGEQIAWE